MSATPESDLWTHFKAIVEGADPAAHLVRVENTLSPGYPDVDYCIAGREGHVELKVLRTWPKRAATVVRVPHYTRAQRDWLVDRHKAGGHVHILIRVADEYLLFSGGAVVMVGRLARADMYEVCATRWQGKIGADVGQWLGGDKTKTGDVK
jgi:hypothetical protein